MVGSILGGLLGNILDNGDEESAQRSQQAALDAIKGLKAPSIESQRLNLDQLASVGDLTPEALETYLQQNSKMEGISTDPRLRAQQMQALQSLIDQSNTGLSEADKAALFKVNKDVERETKGRNDAVLQNMAARGMAGSGAELAAQLSNSQAAADRAQEQGLTVAGQAQQKALQALSQAGQLGGQIRSQDFDQQAQIARAQDAINQFNAANRQNVAQHNVDTRNNAQQYNLNNKQNIANSNVGIRNDQKRYNSNLIQQDFNNRRGLATDLAGAYNTSAGQDLKRAEQTRGMWTGIGQGVDEGAAAYITGGQSLMAPQKKAHGGIIEGKSEVPGDSEKNDKVHTLLSPGEMVIPKSIVDSDNDDVILSFIKAVRAAKGK